MNDIIGALEADHEAAPEAAGAVNTNNVNQDRAEKEPRNSRSLVVDIHLPPASEEEEHTQQTEHVLQVPTSRPCKHELNRFQRCYSDGSQASPKRKAKVFFLNVRNQGAR